MKENLAIAEYVTKMGMTARKEVKIESDFLDDIRDIAMSLVNGDTHTVAITYKRGKLKNHFENHFYYCGGKNCICPFKVDNPQKIRKYHE